MFVAHSRAVRLSVLLSALSCFGQSTYDIHRAASPIVIDGDLGEAAWQQASSVGDFNFPFFKEGVKEQTVTVRRGDNLYTESMVALDADTGRLRWYFQFTPHDVHDWDAVEIPVLVDAKLNGGNRKLLVQANRNGFYYVLDRTTGKFLHGTSFIR